MWLYPLPSLIATVGWLFILVAKYDYLPAALAVLGSGAVIYPLWRAIVGSPPAADKAAT
jgi:hypothetical protein